MILKSLSLCLHRQFNSNFLAWPPCQILSETLIKWTGKRELSRSYLRPTALFLRPREVVRCWFNCRSTNKRTSIIIYPWCKNNQKVTDRSVMVPVFLLFVAVWTLNISSTAAERKKGEQDSKLVEAKGRCGGQHALNLIV